MIPNYNNIPRSTYKSYEGALTANATLAVSTDLGRTAIDGSITNTDTANAFTFKLNSTANDAITLTFGKTFSLEGQQVNTIYLIKGASNSNYAVFVN